MNALFAIRHADFGIDPTFADLEKPTQIRLAEATEVGGVFGPLEWLIIAIGQRDGIASSRSRPLLDGIGKLFDRSQPNGLANPKLDELRRLAAFASEHGWHVPPAEMAAFLRTGWTEDQLEMVIDTVAPPAIATSETANTCQAIRTLFMARETSTLAPNPV